MTYPFSVESYHPTKIVVSPEPGSNISSVCRAAVELAGIKNKSVEFTFNGVTLVAQKETDPDDLRAMFGAELDRRRAEYMASDTYREAEERAIKQAADDQTEVDVLLSTLPHIIGDEPRFIEWIGKFTPLADNVRVTFDKRHLINMIECEGYTRGAYVGWDTIGEDKHIFAGWLVGQVLDCLYHGMPPHPVAVKFAEDYKTIGV